MIELDGSMGEGGGQILRSSLALSLLTGKAFHLANVRAGRERPGLQPQHLMSVIAAAKVGAAQVHGDHKGSTDLVFIPGQVQAGRYRFPIGTAGATGLVLHTVYLPLALSGEAASELVIEGGTHVKAAPCFHFLEETWRAFLDLVGLRIKVSMRRSGFYPKGGGAIDAHITPTARVRPLNAMERSACKRVRGFSAVAGLPADIAQRQARRAENRLKHCGLRVEIDEQTWSGGQGTVLALMLDVEPVTICFFALGERGKRAERVADEAADQVLAYLEAAPAALDPHSADQLVLPLAFADGPSRFTVSEVTQHLLTNVAVIRRFVDRDLSCTGEPGQPGEVSIV
ncbi:MAG: RNA 3'-terminal phosphate cyclase [Gemmataceae bacterium]